MSLFDLPIALSISTIQLERKTMEWLSFCGLLKSEHSLKVIKEQKFIWFASYLFPGLLPDKLAIVMKFFCCLFLLDDLLDKESAADTIKSRGLINELVSLKNLDLEVHDKKVDQENLPFYLRKLSREISQFGNKIWMQGFLDIWQEYLEAQIWEVRNKEENTLPIISEYQERRLASSGVFLALHLLKMDWKDRDCTMQWIERKAARIICLSNDIKSLEKEKAVGDFHNELLLLKVQTGCNEAAVIEFAEKQIQSLFDQLFGLLELTVQEQTLPIQWEKDLLLLLGGCIYWSDEETVRYSGAINGKRKY